MRKLVLSQGLIVILLLQVVLAIVPSLTVASASGDVTVNDFTCNITKGTVPLTAELTSNVTGEVTKWLWEFYNPQTNHWSYNSMNRTAVHTFGKGGTYGVFNVTLEVSGPGGNDSLKKIDYVIANQNTTGLPVAIFSASSTLGNAPLTVKFTDNSIDANSSLWYFGLTDTSTEKNPTFVFTSPGIYRVVLEVSNSRGWDATAQEIIVQGENQEILPVANFSSNVTEGSVPFDVQFTNLSTNATDLQWNFGDGSSNVSDANPEHVFTSTGLFNVVLTASNGNGSDSKTTTINVLKATPTITWSNPAGIAYGTPLSSKQLNAKASVHGTFVYTPAAGTILPVGAQTLKTVFTPKNTTKYSTATQTVIINVVTIPRANFSASLNSGKAPLSVTFTDKSTGSPTTWTWKFGDGGSVTSKIPDVPVHTYTKKGKYTVSLIVKNVAGSSTKTMSITVK
jgi:PKD repeat protein